MLYNRQQGEARYDLLQAVIVCAKSSNVARFPFRLFRQEREKGWVTLGKKKIVEN